MNLKGYTGLFFGTFNPIHIGHLALASHICDSLLLNQIWFVVSPQNPFKKSENLLNDNQRLHMVHLATEDNDKFSVSDVEFTMPKPSYTAHTLTYLSEKHPQKKFALIMGEDNLRTFHKWFNHEEIISNHPIICYPRVKQSTAEPNDAPYQGHPNVYLVDAPVLNLSASFIRYCVQQNIDTNYLLHKEVYKYVNEMNFFK